MNILFHLTTGIAIITTLADTEQLEKEPLIQTFKVGISAFIIGIISHGALDYIPHCYPISSKVDVSIGFLLLLFCIWKVRNRYKIVVSFALLGCIFPDLLDLAPALINKYLGLELPIFNKIFPWHFHEYSGSIYTENCTVSTINHSLVVLTSCLIILFRWNDFRNIFIKGACKK